MKIFNSWNLIDIWLNCQADGKDGHRNCKSSGVDVKEDHMGVSDLILSLSQSCSGKLVITSLEILDNDKVYHVLPVNGGYSIESAKNDTNGP